MDRGLILVTPIDDREKWRQVAADASVPLVAEGSPAEAVELARSAGRSVVLVAALPGPELRDLVDALLKARADAKVVVALDGADPEAPWRPLLQGARDYVTTPFSTARQLERVLARVWKDNGTPQTFMEELVGWHELGATLVRHELTTIEAVDAARALVKRGEAANLFEALLVAEDVSRPDLIKTLDWGHKLVSAAFLLMKTLREALLDRGWCLPQDFDRGPWDDPPPGAPAARKPRPGGSIGEAAAG